MRWSLKQSLMAAVLGVCAAILGCSAQPPAPAGVTLDAVMVKGSRTAPVTIVEFSDYQ